MLTTTGCAYRLNGHLLHRDTVRDIVVRQELDVPWDSTVTRVDSDFAVVEDFGQGVGRFTVEFMLTNQDDQGPDEAEFIIEQITDSPWTLAVQQPALTRRTSLWRNERRLAFATISVKQEPTRRHQFVRLVVEAHMLGVWCSDGGPFYELVRGSFEQVSAGSYETQDGVTQSNFNITLPEQTLGFPKARRTSDNAKVTLTPTSSSTETTRDGLTRTIETYDLSGFLWPSDPASDGDTGVWEVESCPTREYWEGELNPLPVMGVASQSVGSFKVGAA